MNMDEMDVMQPLLDHVVWTDHQHGITLLCKYLAVLIMLACLIMQCDTPRAVKLKALHT
jgi:hypothetical protein